MHTSATALAQCTTLDGGLVSRPYFGQAYFCLESCQASVVVLNWWSNIDSGLRSRTCGRMKVPARSVINKHPKQSFVKPISKTFRRIAIHTQDEVHLPPIHGWRRWRRLPLNHSMNTSILLLDHIVTFVTWQRPCGDFGKNVDGRHIDGSWSPCCQLVICSQVGGLVIFCLF